MTPRRFAHDLHAHTTWSDGAHTVAEQAMQAEAAGLEALAITDHVFPGQGLSDPRTMERYLACVRTEAQRSACLVLAGAEATFLDPYGTVSISPEVAAQLDWVLCDLSPFSVGTLRSPPSDRTTYADNVIRCYHAVCDLPHVDAIAHPFNTGRTTPVLLPGDYPLTMLEELASHMAATGTVFDVMNLMPWWFALTGLSGQEITRQYSDLVRLFAGRGVRFQVSSDDHRCGLGNTRWSELVLERAGVAPEALICRQDLEARLPAR